MKETQKPNNTSLMIRKIVREEITLQLEPLLHELKIIKQLLKNNGASIQESTKLKPVAQSSKKSAPLKLSPNNENEKAKLRNQFKKLNPLPNKPIVDDPILNNILVETANEGKWQTTNHEAADSNMEDSILDNADELADQNEAMSFLTKDYSHLIKK